LIGNEQAFDQRLEVEPQVPAATIGLQAEVEVEPVNVGDHAVSHEVAFAWEVGAW
jgi:hypothetical protein